MLSSFLIQSWQGLAQPWMAKGSAGIKVGMVWACGCGWEDLWVGSALLFLHVYRAGKLKMHTTGTFCNGQC